MLKYPIMYLERTDFTDDGNLVSELRQTPVFVMFQAEFCGHCKTAKPAFQRLAREGIVKCMTVQGDGERKSEKDIVPILSKIYPGFQGYPSYMLFLKDGRKIPYKGKRDLDSMRNFILGTI